MTTLYIFHYIVMSRLPTKMTWLRYSIELLIITIFISQTFGMLLGKLDLFLSASFVCGDEKRNEAAPPSSLSLASSMFVTSYSRAIFTWIDSIRDSFPSRPKFRALPASFVAASELVGCSLKAGFPICRTANQST